MYSVYTNNKGNFYIINDTHYCLYKSGSDVFSSGSFSFSLYDLENYYNYLHLCNENYSIMINTSIKYESYQLVVEVENLVELKDIRKLAPEWLI